MGPNKPQYCSPGVRTKQSCYSKEMLRLIARTYNDTHEDKIDVTGTKPQLLRTLRSKLGTRCGKEESCWLELPFVQKSESYQKLESAFRPRKPESWNDNENEWLNTYDILNVMKQYEAGDKRFKFVGVFPIDFMSKNASTGSCVVQEMCQLDLGSLWKRKITKVGVIFNTDTSKGSGEHWIGLYIGLDPKRKNFGTFFYDSVAMRPPKEVVAFMKLMDKDLKALHPRYADKVAMRSNKVRRQFKSTECGVFSMLFVVSMLRYPFDAVCESMGKDDDVHAFRDVFYRPNDVGGGTSNKRK